MTGFERSLVELKSRFEMFLAEQANLPGVTCKCLASASLKR